MIFLFPSKNHTRAREISLGFAYLERKFMSICNQERNYKLWYNFVDFLYAFTETWLWWLRQLLTLEVNRRMPPVTSKIPEVEQIQSMN